MFRKKEQPTPIDLMEAWAQAEKKAKATREAIVYKFSKKLDELRAPQTLTELAAISENDFPGRVVKTTRETGLLIVRYPTPQEVIYCLREALVLEIAGYTNIRFEPGDAKTYRIDSRNKIGGKQYTLFAPPLEHELGGQRTSGFNYAGILDIEQIYHVAFAVDVESRNQQTPQAFFSMRASVGDKSYVDLPHQLVNTPQELLWLISRTWILGAIGTNLSIPFTPLREYLQAQMKSWHAFFDFKEVPTS